MVVAANLVMMWIDSMPQYQTTFCMLLFIVQTWIFGIVYIEIQLLYVELKIMMHIEILHKNTAIVYWNWSLLKKAEVFNK